MDEVHFVNKGWAGKELQLTKYLKVPGIEAYFRQEELRPYDARVAPAPPCEYRYRLMAPEDAVEVARCVYKTYGRTYPGEQVYFPERVVAMNRSGEMLSAVAVTGSGDVVGHTALSGQPGDRVMEVGQAVVVPAHRGRGILKGLLDLVMGEARGRGLAGLFVRAVTIHPFSQRVCLKYGFQESAVLLGYASQEHQMRGFAEQRLPQRESVVHSYHPLQNEPACLAYPPAHHQDMVARIYRNLGLARELAPPGEGRPDGEASGARDDHPRYRLATKIVPALESAVMAVTGYGPGIEQEVKGRLGELCREGIVTIYLHLPLGDRHTALLCERIEGLGFFFSGILPMPLDPPAGPGPEGTLAPCKDQLCLQYLCGPHIDYDLLQIYSDFCLGLVRYIRERDPLA
jgi:serine/threonine-protein kinase RsbW